MMSVHLWNSISEMNNFKKDADLDYRRGKHPLALVRQNEADVKQGRMANRLENPYLCCPG